MPRRRQPARLYLRRRPGAEPVWEIRDGAVRRSTGCPEREHGAAEAALARYLGERWQPPEGEHHPSRLLIAEVLAAYAAGHAPTVKRPDIIAYSVNHLAGWWGDRTVADIRAGTCRDYAAQRQAAGVAPATARRELEVLRAALGYFAREYGMDGQSPPAVVMPAKAAPRERWLRRAEVARLVRAARARPACRHVERMVLIGVWSGTRPGAILRLSWMPSTRGGWIDLDAGVLHRRAAGTRDDARKRQPPVRIHESLRPFLARWRDADLALGVPHVIHYAGGPVTKLRRSWATVRAAAGLGPDVVPHTLRHTAATWQMQAGTPIAEAAGWLGMTAATLERVYGHHHPDWQQAAAASRPARGAVMVRKRGRTA